MSTTTTTIATAAKAETQTGRQPPSRTLRPRGYGQRPEPEEPLPAPGFDALKTLRLTMNRVALAAPGPLEVVLYALTGPNRETHGDLSAVRGYAAAEHLTVNGPPIVDALDDVDARTGAENPLLRRGYARALQVLADPNCPVRGVVAVSRTSITLADRIYQDQLTWYAAQSAGLWLVRGETPI
ncbi:hypothetical protein OG285_32150 [Streptomyces sp. NBC_01471]|uniref:hypothetical protein n=1 Tax=Streptomyces sp. NBC_01471 TaxID=2903879 RepID=UPI0032449791